MPIQLIPPSVSCWGHPKGSPRLSVNGDCQENPIFTVVEVFILGYSPWAATRGSLDLLPPVLWYQCASSHHCILKQRISSPDSAFSWPVNPALAGEEGDRHRGRQLSFAACDGSSPMPALPALCCFQPRLGSLLFRVDKGSGAEVGA